MIMMVIIRVTITTVRGIITVMIIKVIIIIITMVIILIIITIVITIRRITIVMKNHNKSVKNRFEPRLEEKIRNKYQKNNKKYGKVRKMSPTETSRPKRTFPSAGYAKAYLGSFWSSNMSKRRANYSLKL